MCCGLLRCVVDYLWRTQSSATSKRDDRLLILLKVVFTYFLLCDNALAAPKDVCNGEHDVNVTVDIYDWDGVIESPGFGKGGHPRGNNCSWTWRIHVPSGNKIKITFIQFELKPKKGTVDSTTFCMERNSDFVQISYENNTTRFCYNHLPPPDLTSTTNEVDIQLRLRSGGSAKGFRLQYNGICGELPFGQIHLKPPPVPCVWRIPARSDSRPAFELMTCNATYSQVTPSPWKVSVGYSKQELDLCGEKNAWFYSTDAVLTIRYEPSSIRDAFNGLLLNISSFGINHPCLRIGSDCRNNVTCQSLKNATHTCNCSTEYFPLCVLEHVEADVCTVDNEVHETFPRINWTGEIESPGFGKEGYPMGNDCSWTWQIRVPIGNKIRVTFSHFDLQHPRITDTVPDSNTHCMESSLDFVQVSYDNNISRYCYNRRPPQELLSTTNKVYVQFQVRSTGSANGFRMQYTGVCGDLPSGTYTLKPPPVACVWNINADSFSRPAFQLMTCNATYSEVTPSPWKVIIGHGKQELDLCQQEYDWLYSTDETLSIRYEPPYTGNANDGLIVNVSPFPITHPCLRNDTNCWNNKVPCPLNSKTHVCNCSEDYFPLCAYEANPCEKKESLCHNNGTCVWLYGQLYKCTCTGDYTGQYCSKYRYEDEHHCRQETDSYAGSGMFWWDAKAGETSRRPCPVGISGIASRFCGNSEDSESGGKWSRPDLSKCVNPVVSRIGEEATNMSKLQDVPKEAILDVTNKLASVILLSENNTRVFPGDLGVATDTMNVIADVVLKSSENEADLQEIAEGYGGVVDNILDKNQLHIWKNTNVAFADSKMMSLLSSTEKIAGHVARQVTNSLNRHRRSAVSEAPEEEHHVISVLDSSIEFSIDLVPKDSSVLSHAGFSSENSTSSIELPPVILAIARKYTTDEYVGIYKARFSSMSNIFSQDENEPTSSRLNTTHGIVNSDVVASRVLNIPEHIFQDLPTPVMLTFQLKNVSLSRTLSEYCVFVNMSSDDPIDIWSRKNCSYDKSSSNETHAVCLCNHLTNFAVLMDVFAVSEKLDNQNAAILTYISYIGGCLSVLGCIAAIVVFEFFRIKNDRIRIHEQLAATIICVQVFFLVGIDRTENEKVCKAMTILLHFFLTAMFCWMLVEGVHLYILLVKVFKTGQNLKKYMCIGWGVPLLVVGISVIIFFKDYGGAKLCWLSHQVLLIIFVPTVGLVISINTVVLFLVLRILMRSLSSNTKSTSEDRSNVRAGLKAAAVLLPLLGLTWTLGFLSINNRETLIFTYLFTFFNSLQGVFFFVFHCLLSVDVQNAYTRRYKRASMLRSLTASKSPDRKSSTLGSGYSRQSKSSLNTYLTDAPTIERKRLEQLSDSDDRLYRSNESFQNGSVQNGVYTLPRARLADDVFLPNDIPIGLDHPKRGENGNGRLHRTSVTFDDNVTTASYVNDNFDESLSPVRRRSTGEDLEDLKDPFYRYGPFRRSMEIPDTYIYYGQSRSNSVMSNGMEH